MARAIDDGSGTTWNGAWPINWPVIVKSAVNNVFKGAGSVVGVMSNLIGIVSRRFVPT